MSVRADLADYLQTHDILAVYSFHDDTPDECVALFPYTGEASIYTKDRRSPASESHRVQVVCRSGGDESAEALAEEAYGHLDGADLSGYALIRALQPPFRGPGGTDDEGRTAWMFNLEVRK